MTARFDQSRLRAVLENVVRGEGLAGRIQRRLVEADDLIVDAGTGRRVDLDESGRPRDEDAAERVRRRARAMVDEAVGRWRDLWSDRLEAPLDWTVMTDVLETEPGTFPDDDPFDDLETLLTARPFRVTAAALRALRAGCLDTAEPWLCWRAPGNPERLRVFRAGPYVRYRRELEGIARGWLRAWVAAAADGDEAAGDKRVSGPATTEEAEEALEESVENLVCSWAEGRLEGDWDAALQAFDRLESLARHDDPFVATASLQRDLFHRLRRGWLLDGHEWWGRLRTAVDLGAVEVEDEGAWTFTVASEDAIRAEFAADVLTAGLEGEDPPAPPPIFSRVVPGDDGPTGLHVAVNDPWVTRSGFRRAAADGLEALRRATPIRNVSPRDAAFLEAVHEREDELDLNPGEDRPPGFWQEFAERWNAERPDEWAMTPNAMRVLNHRLRS